MLGARLRSALALVVLLSLLAAGCAGGGTQSAPEPGGDATDDAAGEGAEQEELTPVRLMLFPNFLYMPIFVALDNGYYAEEGLEVEVIEVGSGTDARSALLAGGTDLLGGDAGGTANIHSAEPVSNVMALTNVLAYQLVISNEHAGTVTPGDLESLKGLKIGVTGLGSGTFIYLAAVLGKHGYDINEHLEIIPVGGIGESLTAMQGGQIDGFVSLEPVTSIAIDQEEAAFLFADFGDAPELFPEGATIPTASLAGLKSYVDENPEVVEKVVRATVRAMTELHADPTVGVQSGARIMTDADEAFIQTVVERMVPKYGPELSAESWATMMDILSQFDAIEQAVPYDEIVTQEYADLWGEFQS